jgi:hypothetical protein
MLFLLQTTAPPWDLAPARRLVTPTARTPDEFRVAKRMNRLF